MKRKSTANLILDLFMLVLYLPVMLVRGDIHHLLGQLFGIILFIHIILHWKQLYCLIKAWIPSPKVRIAIICLFCILCIGFTTVLMLHSDDERKNRGYDHKPPYENYQPYDKGTE